MTASCRAAPAGDTLLVAPEVDPARRSELEARLLREASIHPANFRVGEAELHRPVVIGTAGLGDRTPSETRGSLIMELDGVTIVDTFAEAFPMTAARAIVTADTPEWAAIAGRTMSGYATSVIACDAEAAIERVLDPGGDARRPARRECPGLRVQPRGPGEGAGQSRRPVRDDLPHDGLLQRACRRARRPSRWAAASGISATAGRSPSGWRAGDTGACR